MRERERDWPARGKKSKFYHFKIYYCSQLERERERTRTRNRKTLFYKDCSLGSVKNLCNN